MDTAAPHYQPSGKFSAKGLFLTPAFGVPVGVLAAAVYAYVILYLPIVGYVSFLLTFGLGFVVSLAVGAGLTRGKVRSRAVGLALALFVGLATLYASWATWCFALIQRADGDVSLLGVFFSPGGLWDFINAVNEKGAWNLKGYTPTGAVLWALWALEAGIIVGFPLVTALTTTEAPFCEACGEWCGETKGLFRTGPSTKGDVKELCERHAFDDVARLGLPEDGAAEWIRYDLHTCGCRETNALTATLVTVVEKSGKAELKEDVWVKTLLVPAGVLPRVEAVAAQLARLETEEVPSALHATPA